MFCSLIVVNMLPRFSAENSIYNNKIHTFQFDDTQYENRIVPYIVTHRTCPPCSPCIDGEKTCYHYLAGDDSCEPYSVSCNTKKNCCNKPLGYPCP